FELSYIFIIPIRQSYPTSDTCRLPTGHGLMHHNRLQKQLCNYQNASFPLVSRKSSLLYHVRVRKHRFATITRHTGTAQPPQSPRLSPDGHIPDYFLRFSPVVMPGKVVRCFHHQRRLRLTTSGGTFS
ncbi:TPA: hypothetical protein ACG6DJ_004681, partial [Escherichia coli]